MILSDVSVKRPVFAAVMSILLVAFGLLAFDRLPLREFPNIDPPVVSIDTVYRGASADVVESRITRIIEDRIAGVEGIRFIESSSEDGRSDGCWCSGAFHWCKSCAPRCDRTCTESITNGGPAL